LHKKNCCDLYLGDSLCIVTFFLFSDSGLDLFNSFDFNFDLFWMAWHWKPAVIGKQKQLFYYLSKLLFAQLSKKITARFVYSDGTENMIMYSNNLFPSLFLHWQVHNPLLLRISFTHSGHISWGQTFKQHFELLKGYLRTTMTTERFSGLTLMSVHFGKPVDYDAVDQRFATKLPRKMLLVDPIFGELNRDLYT